MVEGDRRVKEKPGKIVRGIITASVPALIAAGGATVYTLDKRNTHEHAHMIPAEPMPTLEPAPLPSEVKLHETGFSFLEPGETPFIPNPQQTLPVALVEEAAHTAQAQGYITSKPDERDRLIHTVGTLQLGLNKVSSSNIDERQTALHKVRGGSWLHVPEDTEVGVLTVGDIPLAYEQVNVEGELGSYLVIYGVADTLESPQQNNPIAYIVVVPGRK